MFYHLLKHAVVDVGYHYAKHGELPQNPLDLIPTSYDEVLFPMLISASPALPASLTVILPEVFGGKNPLLGPHGAFKTPPAASMAVVALGYLGAGLLLKEMHDHPEKLNQNPIFGNVSNFRLTGLGGSI